MDYYKQNKKIAMKKINYRIASLLVLTSVVFTGISCSDDDNNNTTPVVTVPDVNFTALSNNNAIVKYNAQNLNTPISSKAITGLAAGETITSIDYRPATGQLYGLGSTSRLYFINEESGLATPLGAAAFTPAVTGTNASINFNPMVDRVRLVTESGQNLRLHPELGTVAATDTNISGTNSEIGAVAYTNSVVGTTSTVLFDIDFATDKLYIQNPPNNGTLEAVGDLTIDFEGVGDMDILPDNSQAFAVTYDANVSSLFKINLETGKAQNIGTFAQPIIGIAFKTNPIAYAITSANELFRFNPITGASTAVAITGTATGETVVGLDFRPATGQLYGVTNQSRIVTFNTASGAVSVVGAGFTPVLSGNTFGFDFNPTVDRIRLVSDAGQNLRLHPDLGTAVFTDTSLNPGTPTINGAAYTNSFIGATTTTLYVIDSTTNMLYTQNPPNAGTLVPVGALGIDVDADSGFDIGASSGTAFSLLKVGGTTSVYSINLTTGAATKVKDISVNATAMTVGLGF